MEQKKFQVSKGSAIGILTVLSLLWMMHMADRFILIVALTPIKQAFGLTDAQAGLLPALLTAGIAIIGIPAAIFGDRWARRKIVSVMALTWSVFTLGTGIATQFWHLVASRFMVGSGEAGYSPAGTAWLSVVFSKEQRSRIMAIFFACSQLGTVIGLIFGGLLISATQNWRTPFYVFAIPGIILAVIAYFLPDYKSVRQAGESMLSKVFFTQWGHLFKIKSFWLAIISATFVYFMALSIAVWVPTLLIRAYNMDAASSGLAFGLIQLVALLSPFGAVIIDKWQRTYNNARPWGMAIVSFMITATALIAMLVMGSQIAVFLAFAALVTFFAALYIPVLLAVVQDVVPVGLRSTSVGVLNFIAQLTGATLGPILVGVISDALGGGAHGIQVGILWTVPISLLGVVASLLLLKFYSSDSAGVSDEVAAE